MENYLLPEEIDLIIAEDDIEFVRERERKTFRKHREYMQIDKAKRIKRIKAK